MQITGIVIEVFEPVKNTRTPKQEIGVEYFDGSKNKQAKFTLKGELLNEKITEGAKVEIEFELDPWRNENKNDAKKPFYNNELKVTKLNLI